MVWLDYKKGGKQEEKTIEFSFREDSTYVKYLIIYIIYSILINNI